MDIKRVTYILNNRYGVQLTIALVAGVLVTMLFFAMVVKPREKAVQRVQHERAQKQVVAGQYEQFSTAYSRKLEVQRSAITAIIGQGRAIPSDDEVEQEALEYIGQRAQEAGVTLTRLTPVQNDQQQKKQWGLQFSADYRRLTRFMSLLEDRFRIEQFQISGGGVRQQHGVTLMVTAIPVPAGDRAPGGGDIFSLHEEAATLLTDIADRQKAREWRSPIRDPFFYIDTIFPAPRIVEKKTGVEIRRPVLDIEAIFWDPDMPLVSIEGRVMKAGDTIRGMQILKIREKSIDVRWQSQTITYDFQKKGG